MLFNEMLMFAFRQQAGSTSIQTLQVQVHFVHAYNTNKLIQTV